jgi:hypothetical protein
MPVPKQATFLAGLRAFIAFSLAIVFCPGSHAAEMRLLVRDDYRSLVIEGPIESGDYAHFLKVVKDSQGKLTDVYLLSPGGDFVEAMKIGRALRALEMGSVVPGRNPAGQPVCGDEYSISAVPRDPANCTAASAAFFIHVGAVERSGLYLVVHRPSFAPEQFAKLTESQAQAAFDALQRDAHTYMTEMGVPPQVQEEVMGTPPDKGLVVDEKTVRNYFVGKIPYQEEWRHAKCAQLSPVETQRLDVLVAKMLAPGSLTSVEWAEYRPIQEKRDIETKCQVALRVQSRMAAYERFFGIAPSDVTNHNFRKWPDLSRYLGLTFEDVSGEERFTVGNSFMGTTSLDREATATSPAVVLVDSPDRKRYVTTAYAYQTDPSDAFIEHVRTSLTAEWGEPSSSSDTRKWVWNRKNFIGTLTLEKRGSGIILGLNVEAPRE